MFIVKEKLLSKVRIIFKFGRHLVLFRADADHAPHFVTSVSETFAGNIQKYIGASVNNFIVTRLDAKCRIVLYLYVKITVKRQLIAWWWKVCWNTTNCTRWKDNSYFFP